MLLKYITNTNNRLVAISQTFANNVKPLKVSKQTNNYLKDCISYFQDFMLQRTEMKAEILHMQVVQDFPRIFTIYLPHQ